MEPVTTNDPNQNVDSNNKIRQIVLRGGSLRTTIRQTRICRIVGQGPIFSRIDFSAPNHSEGGGGISGTTVRRILGFPYGFFIGL